MSSGTTSQDGAWKTREQSEEARYAHEREQAQLAALKDKLDNKEGTSNKGTDTSKPTHDYEGGFGGQEDLVDRYATTSGEH
jgi:hypothetical protein